MRLYIIAIGAVLLLLALVLMIGPIGRIGGPGEAIRTEDVPQFCSGGLSALVGVLLICGAQTAEMHAQSCPRCGRPSAVGLHCSDCWRELSQEQDDDIEARR